MNRARKLATLSLLLVVILMLASAAQAASPNPPGARHATVSLRGSAIAARTTPLHAAGAAKQHSKLGSGVAEVAAAARVSKAKALDLAKARKLRTLGDRLQVYVTASSGKVSSAAAAIKAAGGEVTKTASKPSLIQAWLPVGSIDQVAASADVAKIDLPSVGIPDAGTQTSEGVAASGADSWQAAGYRGAGTKVAIVDAGFQGYTALKGTDIPSNVIVKSFVDGETDAQVDGTDKHGTACAEIVYDTAPDAQLYLVKVATSLDLQEAVTWLGTQGVDVISMSLSWLNEGPGDGTGLVPSVVAQARSSGITFVTSAGNYRQRHWGGPFSDTDGDGDLNFSSTWNTDMFGPGDHTSYYLFNSGETITVLLRWQDSWTNASQDYNLYLWSYNPTTKVWAQVAASEAPQSGQSGQTPTEEIDYTTTTSGLMYGVEVYAAHATGSPNVELLSLDAELDYQVAARSITSPSDSPYALSVGAVGVNAPYAQESYSSEGPTNGPGGAATGGIVKPDIAAYANVSTVTYGTTNKFAGTSAATPHVAGAAALVASANPSYTPDQIRAVLTAQADDLGSPGKDNQYGSGRLDLHSAHRFTDIDANLVGVEPTSVHWGDYDNDGRLDILITGTGSPSSTKIYHNDGNGAFTNIGANLINVSESAAWGDYNNDGRLDIVITGNDGVGTVTKIYRNDGNGVFTDINAGLPGVYLSSVAWGDYDNDGRLDLLLTGHNTTSTNSQAISRIYHNDGNGVFTDINAGLAGCDSNGGESVWGDYDNDGNLDVLLGACGVIYRNNGNGTFRNINFVPSVVWYAPTPWTWADVDNDGDLDVLTARGALYRNDGNGVFTATNIPMSVDGADSYAWGDYNNDGSLDVLITGSESNPTSGPVTKLFRNDGSGHFTYVYTTLANVQRGSTAWGDYDNDGNLDLLLAGTTSTVYTRKIYHNDGKTPNVPPTAPTGLSSGAGGPATTLSWSAASDSTTPAAGLTYNLRVGTTPGGADVVSPMALTTGYRETPAAGNVGHRLSWTLRNLPLGTYYWSVQAIDTAFAGSPFAPEQSFTVACRALTLSHTGNGTDPTATPASSEGCPAGKYLASETITLTAHPDAGYQVSEWSGTNNDWSNSATNTLTMPGSARTVSVIYIVPPQMTLLPQPVRVVDTRPNLPYLGSGHPLTGTADSHCFQLTGQAGVPSNATAVVVNLTAVGYSRDGWIAAYPYNPAYPASSQPEPKTSSLNFDTQENAIANFAIVALGSGGQLCLTASSYTNAIVDVTGYLVQVAEPQSQVKLLGSPQRVVDTRPNLPYQGSGKPLNGYASHTRFKIAEKGGVPAGATAVLVNLTAVGYKADGWLSAYPACTAQPSTSNVNFDTVENAIAGFAVVKLGVASAGPDCQGAIDVTGAPNTNVIVDVTGYLVQVNDPQIVLLDSPKRIVDTRVSLPYDGSGKPLDGNTNNPRPFLMAGQGGVPTTAKGVIANLTTVGYKADGWVAAYPTGGSIPVTSSVNFDPDENAIANTAILRLGAGGQVSLVACAPTNAIIDVSAYLVR